MICVLWLATSIAQPASTQKPAAGNASQQPYTYSVDVNLVVFNVAVQDSKARPVKGLSKDRFRVIEDGTDQDIEFVRAEDIPATVGLVIDNSGSMKRMQSEVVDAALAFAAASNPQDEIFTVHFNERVMMGLPDSIPFTSSIDQLRNALDRMHMQGKTALYDAIATALRHLNRGTQQRKALVLLSDGGDNASGHNEDQVIDAAQQSNATIYAIGIYDPDDKDRNPKLLQQVAALTGGEAYFPKNADELPAVWRKIADGIRNQYTLGYFSKNRNSDGKFRNVKVTVTDGSGKPLRARTRKGYSAPVAERPGMQN